MSVDQFSLSGRLALITGSSAGIGLALARGMADAGAQVIINGRTQDKVRRVASELGALGHRVHPVPFDVTDPAAVDAAIADIETDVGPIDILVNNAGMQRRAPLETFETEAWRVLMSTNLDSVFYVSRSVVGHMKPRQRGVIINICSVQSELGRPTIAPYTAAKGGVKMLTKGMAIDWGPLGIRVNGLGPGYFATELNAALVADEKFCGWLEDRTPLRRWGDVAELVGAAVFLASDAASFVTGHILYVDGGVTARL